MHCRILRPGHFPSTGVEQIGWVSLAFSFCASCLGCTEGVAGDNHLSSYCSVGASYRVALGGIGRRARAGTLRQGCACPWLLRPLGAPPQVRLGRSAWDALRRTTSAKALEPWQWH